MSATAAQLLNYLNCKAQYNEHINQQIYWSRQLDRNAAMLSKHQQYEAAWEDEIDKYLDTEKAYKYNGVEVAPAGSTRTEAMGQYYADLVVEEYDEETLLECYNLDQELEAIKATYDTMITKLEADLETYKEELSTSASNPETLNGGGG